MKKTIFTLIAFAVLFALTGCNSCTQTFKNLESDFSELDRNVTVINAIKGDTIFSYSGPCYISDSANPGDVTLIYKGKPLPDNKSLVVKVFSFSYKKGIPADDSGNGGGYVFDCRGVHNPGRYDQYKPLNGLDKPVIDFLESNDEIKNFLEHIYALADAHVLRYMERGFTSLMFSCGCTGGRHRSVYSAQHLAEHISRKFGVEVQLEHIEQGISQTFPAR